MSSLSYQILVSTMKQTDFSIYSSMNLNSDAIIVNQGDKNLYEHALICDNDVLMYSSAIYIQSMRQLLLRGMLY